MNEHLWCTGKGPSKVKLLRWYELIIAPKCKSRCCYTSSVGHRTACTSQDARQVHACKATNLWPSSSSRDVEILVTGVADDACTAQVRFLCIRSSCTSRRRGCLQSQPAGRSQNISGMMQCMCEGVQTRLTAKRFPDQWQRAGEPGSTFIV